jgi:FkbM family methyltransferase
MKYVYIDGGARIGESIPIILENRKELDGCDVYLYECNPNHFEVLDEISHKNKRYNFLVRKEALWVENTFKKFYISADKWGDLGSTLKPEKKEVLDKLNPIEVKCVDISEVLNSFNDEDYIILKLDVEGAEYDILNHIIDNGGINKINELYVEFHDWFFNTSSSKIKSEIMKTNIKYNFNWM